MDVDDRAGANKTEMWQFCESIAKNQPNLCLMVTDQETHHYGCGISLAAKPADKDRGQRMALNAGTVPCLSLIHAVHRLMQIRMSK
jgi:hypothetical protein